MPRLRSRPLVLLALALAAACGGADPDAYVPSEDPVGDLRRTAAALLERPEKDVGTVEVQHLLVSFEGVPRTDATRTKEEAEELAADLYQRVLGGEDFDGLVKEHTDDSHPGIYRMTTGTPDMESELYPRQGMARAFGDVGWRLDVGEVGVAAYDRERSPFGWHLIRRLR